MDNNKKITDKYIEDKLQSLKTPKVDEAKKAQAISASLIAFSDSKAEEMATRHKTGFSFMALRPLLSTFSIAAIVITVGIISFNSQDDRKFSQVSEADFANKTVTVTAAEEKLKTSKKEDLEVSGEPSNITEIYNDSIRSDADTYADVITEKEVSDYYADSDDLGFDAVGNTASDYDAEIKKDSNKPYSLTLRAPEAKSLKKKTYTEPLQKSAAESEIAMSSGADLVAEGLTASPSLSEPIINATPVANKPRKKTAAKYKSARQDTAPMKNTYNIAINSYDFAANTIYRGIMPDGNYLKVEEFLNYFNYDYKVSHSSTKPFATTTALYPAPWNKDSLLLHIGIKGSKFKKDGFTTIANGINDIKVAVKFNNNVTSHRLIGYESKLTKGGLVQIKNLAPSQSVTLIYEITLNENNRELGPYGNIKIYYELPDEAQLNVTASDIDNSIKISNFGQVPDEIRFSTAVAAFAQMLKGSEHIKSINFEGVKSIAISSKGEDKTGRRGRFINTIDKAQEVSLKKKESAR